MANITEGKTFAELLRIFRKSIDYGYLPENWHDQKEDILETSSGYFALRDDTVYTYHGSTWHGECDEDMFVYSDALYEYLDEDSCIKVITGRRDTYVYYPDDKEGNFNEYGGDYYTDHGMWCNNLVIDVHGEIRHTDDVYYWECDGEYHDDPEPDEDDEDDDSEKLFSYHSGNNPNDYRKFEDGEITIGFEIEKNEMPDFDFDKHKLYDDGFVIERDGSVSNGFELKTPIYRLYDEFTLTDLKSIKGFCDVANITNAGGHVNIGINGKSSNDILDSFRGCLPLIYAMYKKRLSNSYCNGKNISKLKGDRDKYQSIALHNGYIEFRLVSAVKSFDNLLWRVHFFRIVCQYLDKPFSTVIKKLLSPDSNITVHLRKVYTEERYKNLLRDTLDMYLTYGENLPGIAKRKYESLKASII